jgi:hypothetical protein
LLAGSIARVSVDDLRQQLRDRGYLTHGIERWFALDPWSSRTFWGELAIVALTAALLIALFAALPMTAVMVARNHPLSAVEILSLFASYAVVWMLFAFGFFVLVALILKVRPALPIDTPRALLAIGLIAAAILVTPIAFWWSHFDTSATLPELAAGVLLCVIFFLVASIVVSAALLSFSIYEVQRIPAIHQKGRGVPMTIAAAALIALLFVPAFADREQANKPAMVVTTPTSRRIALIAVDGLTLDILRSRPDLQQLLPDIQPVETITADSTTERWASLGTGVPVEQHGVRSIEGIRFRGGSHVLQRISRADFILRLVATREPLPPTVRRREYIWEILAERGIPSLAVNWWATSDENRGGLRSVSPESIFVASKADPLKLDFIAESEFGASNARFATVYLPSLDVVLNRLELDASRRLALSLQALDGIVKTAGRARQRGYDVVLVGLPGDGQAGQAVVATTLQFTDRTAWDVSTFILEQLGFPASAEMPGRSAFPRIATYGPREARTTSRDVNQEYYDNLKSLGYIR